MNSYAGKAPLAVVRIFCMFLARTGCESSTEAIDRFCALLHGTDDVGEVRVEGHKCSECRAIVSAVPFSLSYVIEIWIIEKGSSRYFNI